MSESSSSRPATPAGDAHTTIARRPHEGAGPCLPCGGRRPGRLGSRRPGGLTRAAAAGLAVATVLAGAALLAACGGSSGAASPSGSASAASPLSPTSSPAAGNKPLEGSPEQAVAAYWALVDAGDYAGLRAACTPGSAAALTAASSDIRRARVVRVARVRREPGGAQVQADVRVVPASAATPWGGTGTHTLFVKLTESAGSGWLVASWATSP